MNQLIEIFESGGGEFFTPPSVLVAKLKAVKAVLFDWDGVFNDGFKTGPAPTERQAQSGNEGSIFSEVDAMGTNMLRYALWKVHAKQTITAVISGEENPAAKALAEREHFHNVFSKAKNKSEVFAAFCKTHSLKPEEVLFFFDDILDLDVARQCGARVMIGRRGNPMLTMFAKSHAMVDYITGCHGGEHGLREGCEMVMALLGQYDAVVSERMKFSSDYQFYLDERQQINLVI